MKVREFRNISKLPDGGVFHDIIFSDITLYFKQQINYGRPLSVSGRPCYILPMFLFIYFFMAALFSILRRWLTEVRENFTRGRP